MSAPIAAARWRAAAWPGFETASKAARSPSSSRARRDACRIAIHVGGLPVFDHREALRPRRGCTPFPSPDYEEEKRARRRKRRNERA